MIRTVKRHVSGFILEPVCLSQDHTLADLDRVRAETGVGSVPVTENGRPGSKLVGLVCARDAEAFQDRSLPLSQVMSKKLVSAREPITYLEAMEKLKRAKVGKLPIVDQADQLVHMVTRDDLKKLRNFPHMSRDHRGQLIVGAAVALGAGGDGWERAVALAEAGADVLCVDVGDVSGDQEFKLLRRVKAEFPQTQVLAGPVSSCREAKRLMDAGADAIRVGCGAPLPGAGGDVPAVGRPEATSVFEVSRYVRLNYGAPVVADGGVRDVGQVLKALGLGASAVMLGGLLAGANESASRHFPRGRGQVKLGPSADPLQAVRCVPAAGRVPARGELVPTSALAMVPSSGAVKQLVPYLMEGVRHGLQDLCVRSVAELHTNLRTGELRMECRSPFACQVGVARARAAEEAAHQEVAPILA